MLSEAISFTGAQVGIVTDGSFTKAKIREVKDELRRHMHAPIDEQGRWLNSVLRGHYAYYGISGNSRRLRWFAHQVERIWKILDCL